MPLGQIRVDPVDFPDEEMTCLRCGQTAPMRFAGACTAYLGSSRINKRAGQGSIPKPE